LLRGVLSKWKGRSGVHSSPLEKITVAIFYFLHHCGGGVHVKVSQFLQNVVGVNEVFFGSQSFQLEEARQSVMCSIPREGFVKCCQGRTTFPQLSVALRSRSRRRGLGKAQLVSAENWCELGIFFPLLGASSPSLSLKGSCVTLFL